MAGPKLWEVKLIAVTKLEGFFHDAMLEIVACRIRNDIVVFYDNIGGET